MLQEWKGIKTAFMCSYRAAHFRALLWVMQALVRLPRRKTITSQNAHINVMFVAWWLKEANASATIRIRMILCLEQPLAQKDQYQIIAGMRQNQLFPLCEQTKKILSYLYVNILGRG